MTDQLPCGFEYRGSHGPYHCHKTENVHPLDGHMFVSWERRGRALGHGPFGRRLSDAAQPAPLDGLTVERLARALKDEGWTFRRDWYNDLETAAAGLLFRLRDECRECCHPADAHQPRCIWRYNGNEDVCDCAALREGETR
jgi:hypothetical protein